MIMPTKLYNSHHSDTAIARPCILLIIFSLIMQTSHQLSPSLGPLAPSAISHCRVTALPRLTLPVLADENDHNPIQTSMLDRGIMHVTKPAALTTQTPTQTTLPHYLLYLLSTTFSFSSTSPDLPIASLVYDHGSDTVVSVEGNACEKNGMVDGTHIVAVTCSHNPAGTRNAAKSAYI